MSWGSLPILCTTFIELCSLLLDSLVEYCPVVLRVAPKSLKLVWTGMMLWMTSHCLVASQVQYEGMVENKTLLACAILAPRWDINNKVA